MRFGSTLALLTCGLLLSGCVPQADYDHLMFLNKSLAAEKEAAEQRALDAEAQAEAIRNQVRMREQELGMQRSLVDNLQSENRRLDEAFATQQDLVNRIDLTPQRPLVIQQALPAELDAALRNFAASHPDAIEYDPARGAIKWKSDLLFASGSDVVKAEAKSTLRSFANVVNSSEAGQFEILVVGHTDDDPIVHARHKGHPTNWHLSAHRAIAVSRELMSAQVSPQRIGVMGYGEYRPISPNDNKDSKARNRRVEVFLIGPGEMLASNVGASSTPAGQAEPQK